MSTLQPLPEIEQDLADAAGKASKYEWMKAADTYRQILDKVDRNTDPGRIAQISELAATSYFKAAFQSTTRKDFQDVMRLSERFYQDLAGVYQSEGLEALAKRARARGLFANFWNLDTPDDKRSVLEQCIPLAQESAQLFEVHGERKQLPETLLDLLIYR